MGSGPWWDTARNQSPRTELNRSFAFVRQHIRFPVNSVHATKLVADEFHTRLFRNAGALTGVDEIVPQRVGAVFPIRDIQLSSNDTVKALRNGRTPETVLVCMQFTKQMLRFAVV